MPLETCSATHKVVQWHYRLLAINYEGANVNVLSSRKVCFPTLARWRDRADPRSHNGIWPTGTSLQEGDRAGTREELRRVPRSAAENGWAGSEQLRCNDAR